MADEKEKEEGAKEGEGAPTAAAEPKKKSNMLLIVGVLVLVLVAAGIPTTLLLMKKEAPKTQELAADAAEAPEGTAIEGAGEEAELGEDEEQLGVIFPLDTFVVNLSGGKYLRTQMQLEFVGRDVPPKFVARLVPSRDAIITLLTKKTPDELEGSKGKEALRSEVKELVNEILKKEEVKRVYFTQFVIQ